MPHDARDPVLAAALDRSTSATSSRVALLVQHENAEHRRNAAAQLRRSLIDAGVFMPIEEEGEALFRWFFANRDQLICPPDRSLLEAGEWQPFLQQALARIYTPLTPINGDLLNDDPLLLSLRLLDCFGFQSKVGAGAGLIVGQVNGSPYALEVQDRLEEVLEAWQDEQAAGGVEVARAGAVFHASAAASRARVEIAWISTAAVVLVLVMLRTLLSSFRTALLVLASLAIAFVGGLAVCLLLFERIHALALVIGAALAGAAVDYAVHVTAAGLRARSRGQAIDNASEAIGRPLLASMMTTLAGFACLFFSGIELMHQIAVMGAAGIVCSFAYSRLVMGRFLQIPEPIPLRTKSAARQARRILDWRLGSHRLLRAAAALSVLGMFGLLTIATNDDVRTFQPPPTALLAEEEIVLGHVGADTDPRFLLARASSLEELRMIESGTLNSLKRPLPVPAWLDPPQAERDANRQLIDQQLLSKAAPELGGMLGIDVRRAYESADDTGNALPNAELRGHAAGLEYSIIPLGSAAADGIAAERLDDHIQLVDPAASYSSSIHELRLKASMALVLAITACGAALLAIYRRASCLRMLLPPGLAIFLVPTIAMLAGFDLSLFSIMGLFIVLSTGIDFAIFQNDKNGEHDGWRDIGILVAAISTIIPMTVLAFSETLPVQHFGFAVAVGMTMSLLLSPLARSAEVRLNAGIANDEL